jgi:deoxycytidine triphosphate deaminase
MTGVLSDNAIRKRLDELIDGGDAKHVGSCAYYFYPAKIFRTGSNKEGQPEAIVDFADPKQGRYAIAPGELVMLRTRETVKMPRDMCGLWFQSDALARDALLLVNMSVIPPGFVGRLNCTFANFGKVPVEVGRDVAVAKVLFVSLDQQADRMPEYKEEAAYEDRTRSAAFRAPKSFFQIADRKQELTKIATKLRGELEDAAKKAGEDVNRKLVSAPVGMLKKAAPLAVFTMLLLSGSNWWISSLLTRSIEKEARERADLMEAEIQRQLSSVDRGKPVIVYSGSPEAKALMDRISLLEDEIKEMNARASAPTKPK